MKLIAQNKKAYRDYYIEETFQAGIALAGTEVKSLRLGKCSLKESYVKIKNGEAFLINAHISPYEQGNIFNKDPFRERKLLLRKRQIFELLEATQKDGYTIAALKIYFHGSLVKVDVAIAKGKKLYDKREALAKKDAERDMERVRKLKS